MDEVFYLINGINMVVGTTTYGEDGTYTVTWHDDEDTTSEFDNLHEYYNAVLAQGIRVASFEDTIVQTYLSMQTLRGDLERKDEQITELKDNLRQARRNSSELAGTHTSDVNYLIEALCQTVDYVGTDTLPPVEGWSWFDALKKYRPYRASDCKRAYDELKSARDKYSVESHIADKGMDPETTKDLLHLQNQVRELEVWLADILSEPREEQVDREETLLETVQRAMSLVQTAGSPSISQATLQRSLQDLLESSQLIPAKDGLYTENEKGAYVFKFK